jgi:hypothetical protein
MEWKVVRCELGVTLLVYRGCGDITWQLQGSGEGEAICRIRTKL